jgi:tRNA nucleotidyltransferase (CCA-adding enzyme)
MPDYIYLLKNRLSIHQRNALDQITLAAREAGMTVFLVGGAVRDLTSGSPVFDLDVTVQGNALKLKKPLEKAGGKLWGEHEPSRTLFFRFPVGVTVEISSARREEYPKPGKPVYHWDTILDDLRRRDFTANAMALSLNEHSYGLLMDPLNGVADIEARQLRLVSNYGFIEDPSRLLRATRLVARLGWQLDERTQTRFQNSKEEKAIEALSAYHRGYELEEIGHEEDGLRVLAAMEAEGWMHYLFPAWTTAAADATALEEMRKLVTQLQMQGVSPDISAVSVHYLTAKLSPKDLAGLKALFVRPGFVEEWNNLDHAAREFNKQLMGKEAATPSATWKLFTTADPQAVLWLGLTSKTPAVQAKYKNFFTVWPEARQKIPHALLQELRITPEVPGYDEMISRLFLGVIDGILETDEQLRAFLEPYSPPAPPPPVTVRRTRGSKKSGEKSKVPVEAAFDGDADDALQLDEDEAAEEPIEDVDDEDDGDSEPPVTLPPAAKKSAPAAKKSPAESQQSSPVEKPSPSTKPEAPPAKAGPSVAKSAPSPALHVVAPAKQAKVHVMAKQPGKPTPPPAPPPAPNRAQSSKPSPNHAPSHHSPSHHAPSHAHPAGKKALPMKTVPAKAAVAKHVPAKSVPSKSVPVKMVRGPVAKPAAVAKPAVKHTVPGKKTAVKAPVKVQKKLEPAKKPHPAKKPVPARKHK